MRFHPDSDMPMFETQRRLRGHAFYPGSAVLRRLLPTEERPKPDAAPCVVYFSPWGHLVVTEIDRELNAYGWVCWSHDPMGAEWGDLGFLGEYEKRRAPFPSIGWWERDLHAKDRTAAAAVARILRRYETPLKTAQPEVLDVHAALEDAGLTLGGQVEYDDRTVSFSDGPKVVPGGRARLTDVWASGAVVVARVEREDGCADTPLLTDLRPAADAPEPAAAPGHALVPRTPRRALR